MKRTIITICLIIFTLSLSAQVSKSLSNVAGSLSSSLTKNEKNTITSLTIKGSIDARDFKTMRDSMPVLSIIDISGAKIITYTGSLGTAATRSTTYNANTVPVNAFFNLSNKGKQTLNEIKLNTSTTAIGTNAFRDCSSLASFPLPPSLESIGLRAFKSCSNFTGELTIPGSVISIGESAFEESGILEAIINGPLTEIAKKTFMECPALKRVSLPQTLISIGDSSFFRCESLHRTRFPDSLKTIGIRAFYYCDFYDFSLNEGLVSIGEEAFYNCKIEQQIIIPVSIRTIGKGAFRKNLIPSYYVENGNQYYSSLNGALYNKNFSELVKIPIMFGRSFHIPSSVKIIAPYAIEGSASLYEIFIPESVDSIGEGAFLGITPEIIVLGDSIPTDIEGYRVFDYYEIPVLHVPLGSKSLYLETEPWFRFKIEEGKLLKLSNTNISLSNISNSSTEVIVFCNNFWTAVSDQSWLKVTPSTTSFGNLLIKMTADQNLGEERKANIIVMSPAKIDTIFVTQEKFSGIVFSDTLVNVDAKDNLTDSIDVISSGTWIASSDKAWLSLSPAIPVNGNGTLNIQAQPNNGDERSATITVISEGALNYITVIQTAGANSVSELKNENKLVVSPNPAKNFIQMNNLKGKEKISIYNSCGMKIKNINIEPMNLIDISDLKSGFYFISFDNKWGKFLKNN